MYPILFELGPIKLYSYGLLVALGFVAGVGLASLLAIRDKRFLPSAAGGPVDPDTIIDLGMWVLVAAIAGARLLHVIVNYPYYFDFSRPAQVLEIFAIWKGGLVFYGGLMAALPVGIWFVRRRGLNAMVMADLVAPSIPLGHAFGRLGCFLNGCCYGREVATCPPGVHFPDVPGFHLPTQLIESGVTFLICLGLLFMRRWRNRPGLIMGGYLAVYGLYRFGIEFVRGDAERGTWGWLTTSQWIAALMFSVGFYWVTRALRQPRLEPAAPSTRKGSTRP